MITRIEIKNFMSHSHTVIEPAQGLTVIVGENNTGKSALISALQVLCRNAPGDYMVRHGSKECSITVTTREGDEIAWKRKGRVVSYTINGKDIHRLGGSVPDELHELLRLPLVETENEPFDIHFGEQKRPIFLLNESASRRATFFASSSDTIKLIEMQNRHRRNIQEAKSRENELVRREALLVERVDRLAPIDNLEKRLDRLESDYEILKENDQFLQRLRKEIGAIETMSAEADFRAGSVDAAKDLCAPPQLKPVEPLQRLISSMKHGEADVRSHGARMSVVKDILSPPLLADTRRLGDLIGQITILSDLERKNREIETAAGTLCRPPEFADVTALDSLIKRIDHIEKNSRITGEQNNVLDRLSNPPPVHDPEPLRQGIKNLEAVTRHIHFLETCNSDLNALSGPPDLQDISFIRNHMERMAAAQKECETYRNQLNAFVNEMAAAEEELKEYLDKAGICPTCGQEIDPDKFIHMTPLALGGAN